MIKEFYTIDEAAQWLSSNRHAHSDNVESEISKLDVTMLASKGELPICFRFNGHLFGVKVYRSDELSWQVESDVKISGILKSLVFQGDDNGIEATLVSVVQLDSLPVVKGNRFPTTEEFGGNIQQGYEVRACLNFEAVPSSKWLCSIDDLRAITGERDRVEAVPVTAPALDAVEIPGKQPNVASRKMAIEAAWKIESDTGRAALAKDVMKLLQSWADDGSKSDVLIKSDKSNKGVVWRTSKGKENLFDMSACGKALETWMASRE